MVTDLNYRDIAKDVYEIDIKKTDLPYQEGDKVANNRFQILKALDNTTNGMQAMAVAPIINGKVDTSQIVVAYAGTNQDDEHDIDTDIQTVIGGRTETLSTDKQILDAPWGDQKPVATTYTDSQLKTAKAFYDKVRKAYPQAQLTTTGHSLGGYLALVVKEKAIITMIRSCRLANSKFCLLRIM